MFALHFIPYFFMLSSTLIAVFRLMEPADIELMDQLINTPLFKIPNRHKDTVAVWQFLKPYAPRFTPTQQLEKTVVAQQLFGHRAAPEKDLRKAMSLLLGMIKKTVLMRQVIGTQAAPEQEYLRAVQTDLGLLRWLTIRTQNTITAPEKRQKVSKNRLLVDQQYRAVHAATNDFPVAEGARFNQKNFSEWQLMSFWREYELLEYAGHQRLDDAQTQHLSGALTALDQFYYQMKMNLVTHLQVKHLVRPIQEPYVQIQIDAAQQLMQQLPEHLQHVPALQVYAAVSQMLYAPETGETAYQKTDHLLKNKQLNLPEEIIKSLKTIQSTYCAKLYNQTGDQVYLQRRFDLFKESLEADLAQQNGKITAVQLSGTVSNALKLGPSNHRWVTQFLARFSQGTDVLGTETPREVYKVNRAHLLLQQGHFREASNELIGYEWYSRLDDPQILLLAIRIDLKIQFELKRYTDDYTMRTLDTAEKRILRLAGLDEQQRSMTLLFLRFIKQLSLLFAVTHLYTRIQLVEKVEELNAKINLKPIAEKEWLMAKVNVLANGLHK